MPETLVLPLITYYGKKEESEEKDIDEDDKGAENHVVTSFSNSGSSCEGSFKSVIYFIDFLLLV